MPDPLGKAPRLSRPRPGANAPGFVVFTLSADHRLHQLLQCIGHGAEAAKPGAPDGPQQEFLRADQAQLLAPQQLQPFQRH
ncbi:MAG: hypothetical protein ACK52U_11090 [Synechococcaceae cyanobacterium]